MAIAAEDDDAAQPLKYKTWVLKVLIHCDGCKKQVRKILQSVEGVYKTEIDSQQHKATVTGDVDSDKLIKKLLKNGKHAEVWPQDHYSSKSDEQKPAGKSKKKKKNKKEDPVNNNHENNIIPGDDIEKYLLQRDEDPAEETSQQPNGPHPDHKKPDETSRNDKSKESEKPIAGTEPNAHTTGKKKKKKKKSQNGDVEAVEVAIEDEPKPIKQTSPMMPSDEETVPPRSELTNPPSPGQPAVQPSQPQPAYHVVPPYDGVISYNAAYPSLNPSSYYDPPMHYSSYADDHNAYFGHPSHHHQQTPQPSDPIRPTADHYRDHYDYDDEESGCKIM